MRFDFLPTPTKQAACCPTLSSLASRMMPADGKPPRRRFRHVPLQGQLGKIWPISRAEEWISNSLPCLAVTEAIIAAAVKWTYRVIA